MEEYQILASCLPEHPSRLMVCGPSSCGKTSFVQQLLLHPQAQYEALYICAHRLDQPIYREITNSFTARGLPVTTYNTIPEEPIDFDNSKKNIMVVDDLIAEAEKSSYMGHLMRDGCHHDNVSLILISHWCCGTADSRRQRLQVDYMVLFRFCADKKAVHGIGGQIAPGAVDRFMIVYHDATSVRYRPLIIDLSNAHYIDERLRFRCGAWNIIYPYAAEL